MRRLSCTISGWARRLQMNRFAQRTGARSRNGAIFTIARPRMPSAAPGRRGRDGATSAQPLRRQAARFRSNCLPVTDGRRQAAPVGSSAGFVLASPATKWSFGTSLPSRPGRRRGIQARCTRRAQREPVQRPAPVGSSAGFALASPATTCLIRKSLPLRLPAASACAAAETPRMPPPMLRRCPRGRRHRASPCGRRQRLALSGHPSLRGGRGQAWPWIWSRQPLQAPPSPHRPAQERRESEGEPQTRPLAGARLPAARLRHGGRVRALPPGRVDEALAVQH